MALLLVGAEMQLPIGMRREVIHLLGHNTFHASQLVQALDQIY
jgi:hypothetical protein